MWLLGLLSLHQDTWPTGNDFPLTVQLCMKCLCKFDVVPFRCSCHTYTSLSPTTRTVGFYYFSRVLAENHSHLSGATNIEDVHNMLCRLSVTTGKMFVHVSVIH